jgi:hypothetical protein
MKNYAQFNIIIVDFIRIVIIFIKYNTFYFTYPPRKHDFSHILPSCLLFIAESGKYHPVVVLLHNHKWLKKFSKKVSSSLETVKCILSSILCPSIFREIWRHCMASRFTARQMPLLRLHMYLDFSIQEYFIVEYS